MPAALLSDGQTATIWTDIIQKEDRHRTNDEPPLAKLVRSVDELFFFVTREHLSLERLKLEIRSVSRQS